MRPTKPLTEDKIPELLRLYHDNVPLLKIAKLLDVNSRRLAKYCKENITEKRTRKSQAKYKHNSSYFFNIDTEKKAYWLGFILADGNVSKDGFYLTIGLKEEDAQHLNKFVLNIESDIPVTITKNGNGCDRKENKFNLARIILFSKQVVSDLNNLGIFPNKTDLDIPFDIPEGFEIPFWRGMIDGDGSLYWFKVKNRPNHRSGLEFCGSLSHVLQFESFIRSLGITSGTVSPDKSIFRFQLRSASQVSKAVDVIYGNSTIHLDRKKVLADDFMSSKGLKPNHLIIR